MSSSHDASSHARVISRSMRKSNALRTSGRLSVIVARGGAFGLFVVEDDRANHFASRSSERVGAYSFNLERRSSMGKRVVHVEFPAQDIERGKKFWEGVGGWGINDAGMQGMQYLMWQEGD